MSDAVDVSVSDSSDTLEHVDDLDQGLEQEQELENDLDQNISSLDHLRLLTEQAQTQLCKQKDLILEMEALLEHLSSPPRVYIGDDKKDLHTLITECADASMTSILNDSRITFGELLLKAL